MKYLSLLLLSGILLEGSALAAPRVSRASDVVLAQHLGNPNELHFRRGRGGIGKFRLGIGCFEHASGLTRQAKEATALAYIQRRFDLFELTQPFKKNKLS